MRYSREIFLIREGLTQQKKTIIIVSKRNFPSSVLRHKVKRQIREAIRLSGKQPLFNSKKIIVTSNYQFATFQSICEEMKKIV